MLSKNHLVFNYLKLAAEWMYLRYLWNREIMREGHTILGYFKKILGKTISCRGIITAPSHAKLKVQYPPPPHGITAHAWGDLYVHTCTSLCSPNGQPAIQAKYMYSTCIAFIRLYWIGPCQVQQRRRSRAQIQ